MATLAQILAGGDPEAEASAAASSAMAPAVSPLVKLLASGELENYYDPSRSFAQNALDPRAIDQATNLALGVSGGGLGTRTAKAAASDIAAPYIGKGSAAPLFDYSRLSDVPNVPQFPLDRAIPPKGVPDRVQALAEPANVARVNDLVAQGIPLGGREWYNTEPLLRAFQGELGEGPGQQAYQQYVNLIGATSPQTVVPQNLRNASYFHAQNAQGNPIPTAPPLPYPYGTLGTNITAAHRVLDNPGDIFGGVDVLQHPKPPSFAQNIMGNQMPVAVDTHNARMWGLKNTKGAPADVPSEGSYGFMEGLNQGEAAKMGMTPAQYQASGWLGAGGETGLKSPVEPLLQTFENRVRLTADKMGMNPQDVLKSFLRGGMSLLSVPLGFGMLSGGAVPGGSTGSSR